MNKTKLDYDYAFEELLDEALNELSPVEFNNFTVFIAQEILDLKVLLDLESNIIETEG